MDYLRIKKGNRKKLNIIVHGVSESEKRKSRDRKEDDTQVVKIFFGELGVEAKIKNVIRLGKVVHNKNRFMKVVLKD